eukprot:TRINITY_DN2385_c0_g1_i2.p1 TRINITY_DN2385_c0_g1~~TRINITY_DN2385_c0_g1_i2.p1  ORF type:complete len:213 (-),score=60.10 TRINITY_DN2385_c0_g1_i2:222-860(-)
MLSESNIDALFEPTNEVDRSNAYTATTQPVYLKKEENNNNSHPYPYEPISQYHQQPSTLECFDNDRNSQGSMVRLEKEYEIAAAPYQRSNALLQNDYPTTTEYTESFYSSSNTVSTITPESNTTLNIYPSTTTIIQQEVQPVAPQRRRVRRSRHRDTVKIGGITIGWVLFVGLLIVFGPFILIPLFPLIPFFFIWWGSQGENTTTIEDEYVD